MALAACYYVVRFCLGSFVVVDAQNLTEIIGFHHRKEEISDVKFSPRKYACCLVFEI